MFTWTILQKGATTMTMARKMIGGFAPMLMLLAAVAVRADEAEDKAVQAIEKLGGKVTRDEKAVGRPVVEVDLFNRQVADADLKELAQLKQLQSLNLHCTEVTDAGLKELAALKQLQSLNLVGTKVTDAGLKELAAVKPLQMLDLHGTQVTDAGLKELAALKNLQSLDLGYTKLTDAGLKELAAAQAASGVESLAHAGDRRGPEGTGRTQTIAEAVPL